MAVSSIYTEKIGEIFHFAKNNTEVASASRAGEPLRQRGDALATPSKFISQDNYFIILDKHNVPHGHPIIVSMRDFVQFRRDFVPAGNHCPSWICSRGS